jgi:MOSC domain-containing protein YiiM
MKIISVNTSLPKEIQYRGQTVKTGIFKTPVEVRLQVSRMGLATDVQVDRRYHGGQNKAVYSYAQENYQFWAEHLGKELPPGTFGENLTTLGLSEEAVGLGDRYRIGTVELVAIQPRMPCYKLGVKMADMTFLKKFKQQNRHGIYWQVDCEGELQSGDEIVCMQKNADAPKVFDVWKLCMTDFFDENLARKIVNDFPLDKEWREGIEQKIEEA